MKRLHKSRLLAAAGLALVLSGTVLAQEPPAEPAHVPLGVTLVPLEPRAEPTSREAVRDEFLGARLAGTLTPDGELGDTPAVLAARDSANAVQAEQLAAGADVDTALRAATEAAVQMSGADAIADADVYEMTGDDGELLGFLFVVEQPDD